MIVTGAPLTARTVDIVRGLQGAGWGVTVAATEAARPWVDVDGITAVAGSPPRFTFADPAPAASQGPPSAVVIAPATFNTVNKLAAGIADTLPHTAACQALGARTKLVVVPMASPDLWAHPAMDRSLQFLRQSGVCLVDVHTGGSDVGPFTIETGPQVVEAFDPGWLVAALGPSS